MKSLVAIASFILATLPLGVSGPPARPDIVLVIADDLDVATLTAALQGGFMPNLAAVQAQGTTFNHSYVTDARGCPTRESWLTGLYFSNLQPGVTACGVSLFKDANVLPVWLHAAGYRTGLIGKYLDGSCYTDCNHDGRVEMTSDTTFIPPGWETWQELQFDQPWYTPDGPPDVVTLGNDNPNQYEYFLNNNGALQYYGEDPEDYQSDVLRGMAQTFVSSTDARPFFLYLSYGAPHVESYQDEAAYDQYTDAWTWTVRPSPTYAGTISLPLESPVNFNEFDVSDKPYWIRGAKSRLTATDITNVTKQWQDRIAALRTIDDSIGDIVSAEQAAHRKMILIFTSDNGWQYGNHRLCCKLDAYEESINVPLIVSVGGGAVSEGFLTPNDMAPTIMELARAVMPYPGDGRSFVPLLGNPSQPWRNRFLVEHWTAMAKGTFDMPDYLASRTAPTAANTPDQLYVRWETGETEFYDLPTDPGEMISRHASPDPRRQAQIAQHQQDLAALAACKNGMCQTVEFAP